MDEENKQQKANEIYTLEVKRLRESILDIEENRRSRKVYDEGYKKHSMSTDLAMKTNKVILVAAIMQTISVVAIAALVAYNVIPH